jgi:hypothetical protein
VRHVEQLAAQLGFERVLDTEKSAISTLTSVLTRKNAIVIFRRRRTPQRRYHFPLARIRRAR